MRKHRLFKTAARLLTGIVLTASLIAGGGFSAAAAAEREAPDFKRNDASDCSIHVTMETTVEDQSGKQQTVKLDGGQLELIRAAEAVEEDGNYLFRFTGPFSGMQDPIAVDSDLTGELAAKLSTAAGDNASSNDTIVKTADVANGAADFTGLPLGLYLIRQKTVSGNYEAITPFLVTVPRYNADGKAVYDAVAAPKIGGGAGGYPGKPVASCKADPPVRKVVRDTDAATNQEFFFEFKRLDAAYPMPADGTVGLVSRDDAAGTMILKAVTDSKTADGYPTGIAEAGNIHFTKLGEYRYTYRELSDGEYKKYDYDYDTTVYYITYTVAVIDGKIGISKIDVRLNDKDGTIYKTLESDTDIPDRSFAGPKVIEFEFDNYPKDNGGANGGGGGSGGGGSGGTGRSAYNFGGSSAPGGTEEGVLGANRDTDGGEDSGVLGADRDPQAVLGATRLPQTGQLWWPVPILLIVGIILIGGGFFGRRKDE